MEFVALWLGCAVVAAIVASARGRSAFGWLLLGVFFGIFALILVALLPSLKAVAGAPMPDTHVRCPDCKEFVQNEARVCKHCGAKLLPVSMWPRPILVAKPWWQR